MPHLDADIDTYVARVREVNPTAVAAGQRADGEGMDAWFDWLRAFVSR